MKVVNRIFNIFIIFIILQMFGIIITNSVYAEGIFENVFNTGKTFKENIYSSNTYTQIKNEANGINSDEIEVYNVVRLFCASCCLLYFIIIVIGLNTGKLAMDKAQIKLHLGVTVVVAILFIFAKQIFDWLSGIIGDLTEL